MDMKELKKALLMENKNGYSNLNETDRKAMNAYCEGYKAFLDAGKTERECVTEAIRLAEAQGFKKLERGVELKAGDKVYANNRGKMLTLAVIGTEPLEKGVQITAAHVDAPRLDLKPSPLYEDSEIAYLKTHYYGGIRKYQWVTVPLEIHGVVSLKDGTNVEVRLGEGNEPKLVISDLLPHLAADQNKKTLPEGIEGEQLNLIVGSEPLEGEESDSVKLHVMKLLNEKYGFVEADFISAELEVVPAYNATDIGLDGSLLGAYGHDDRVCAYAALKAMFDLTKTPAKTSVCILADKEEIGSEGTSGMQSQAFECFMEDLCDAQGVKLRHCFANSFCLSADVCNAYDPMFAEISEKRSNAKCNYGMGILKFTGRAGKGGTNDADAETVGKLRKIFDDHNVVWQMGALGKVDQGGGGTVALFMSRRNISTIDAGVPVLSMHAPFELVAKFDTYMTYKGVMAVYDN